MTALKQASLASHDNRHKLFLQIIDLLWNYDDQGLRDLADEAGCHWVTLYSWKSGRVTSPQLNKIAGVAGAMGYELTLVKRRAALRRVK